MLLIPDLIPTRFKLRALSVVIGWFQWITVLSYLPFLSLKYSHLLIVPSILTQLSHSPYLRINLLRILSVHQCRRAELAYEMIIDHFP